MFSCEFCEIFKSNFFTWHLRTTASGSVLMKDRNSDLVKKIYITNNYNNHNLKTIIMIYRECDNKIPNTMPSFFSEIFKLILATSVRHSNLLRGVLIKTTTTTHPVPPNELSDSYFLHIQRHIQNPVKPLLAVNYFRQTLHLICFTRFWIRLWHMGCFSTRLVGKRGSSRFENSVKWMYYWFSFF